MLLHPPVEGERAGDVSVVVMGAAIGRDAAREAVEAVDGRLVVDTPWTAATTAIALPDDAVLMIETEGVDDDVLAVELPRLDEAASALDVPVVVALDERSIDIVSASMLKASAQLLCSPSVADRVVALAIAARDRGIALAADSIREGEAARLQRLNDEVARIAEVLSRLTRRGPDERSSVIVYDRPSPFLHQERPDDIVIDAAEVRRAIRARRMRDQHFGSGFFEDPAWDIVLDLFAAELEGAQVSVSSLCIAAAVAPTTALRWIAKLTEAGLLERHPDPFDRRRAFMELSPRAGRAIRDHVAALRHAGLPFG